MLRDKNDECQRRRIQSSARMLSPVATITLARPLATVQTACKSGTYSAMSGILS